MASHSLDSFTKNYLQGRITEANMEFRAPAAVLEHFGFEVELASSECVSGHFTVTERCCQPFMMLHGGISALISEVLASMGAHIASGFRRIAGIELNINHLKAVSLGTDVYACAKPISGGKRIQVWEVKFWKIPGPAISSGIDCSALPMNSAAAISRVTFLVGLPISSSGSENTAAIKRVSRM